MYIDWSKYPANYDWLNEEEKNEILEYLNVGDDNWKNREIRYNEERREYARKLYEERGIAVEWNWSGHTCRGRWILVDQWRAEEEWDWMLQCAD